MKLKNEKKIGCHWATLYLTFEWIKTEDSENLTKNQKYEERTSLNIYP